MLHSTLWTLLQRTLDFFQIDLGKKQNLTERAFLPVVLIPPGPGALSLNVMRRQGSEAACLLESTFSALVMRGTFWRGKRAAKWGFAYPHTEF